MTLISNNRFLIRVCVPLLVGLMLYFPGVIYSLEIYTLIGDDCGTNTGLIVGGDERRIYMLNVDGNLSSICLLYTSPSPRDRTRSRMPSSA